MGGMTGSLRKNTQKRIERSGRKIGRSMKAGI